MAAAISSPFALQAGASSPDPSSRSSDDIFGTSPPASSETKVEIFTTLQQLEDEQSVIDHKLSLLLTPSTGSEGREEAAEKKRLVGRLQEIWKERALVRERARREGVNVDAYADLDGEEEAA